MYNSSIKRSKCTATNLCMATGIVNAVCFYVHSHENYMPDTYVRDYFHLHMCNYLFTKLLCVYLLSVHTWGVCVHIYLFICF